MKDVLSTTIINFCIGNFILVACVNLEKLCLLVASGFKSSCG